MDFLLVGNKIESFGLYLPLTFKKMSLLNPAPMSFLASQR